MDQFEQAERAGYNPYARTEPEAQTVEDEDFRQWEQEF